MKISVTVGENVRSSDVFIIQSTCAPVNERTSWSYSSSSMRFDASAEHITAVIPYYGYARQDRKVAPRTPISAKLVADPIASAGRHACCRSTCMLGRFRAFSIFPDHLYAMPVLIDHMRQSSRAEWRDHQP